MAENKIFAGPARPPHPPCAGPDPTAMAEALEISPSYLNLIERNQRPLTVQLIIKLSTVYKVDLDELQGEAGGTAKDLREVFADPLLSGEVPGEQEIIEVAEAAPNAAPAWSSSTGLSRTGPAALRSRRTARPPGSRDLAVRRPLPLDEVREKLEARPNFHARIEDAAEAFAEMLKPGDDLAGALKAWLRPSTALSCAPCRSMPCRICAAATTGIRCGSFSPSGSRPSTSCARLRWKPARSRCARSSWPRSGPWRCPPTRPAASPASSLPATPPTPS